MSKPNIKPEEEAKLVQELEFIAQVVPVLTYALINGW